MPTTMKASRIRQLKTGRALCPSSVALVLVGLLSLAIPPATRGADNVPPPGFVALFNGRDFSRWNVPEGDNGHWKVLDGVIDYDAATEAPGDKNLWTEREFGDFVLQVDWRIKEVPYVNPNVFYSCLMAPTRADVRGKELRMALPDSDSGVFIRGSGKYQVNIWCWPIGSGEMYSVRIDPKTSTDVRAAVTPRSQADKPVGQWNHFESHRAREHRDRCPQ